ncbi:MAG: hypothetical protein V1867_06340 [Candidatus Falkowbacteria bacterium]
MTLTAEQFNKIALKTDLDKLKDDLEEKMMTKDDKNEIMSAIDGLAKLVKDDREENAAYIAAHERLQEDINEVREHTGIRIKHPVLKRGKI